MCTATTHLHPPQFNQLQQPYSSKQTRPVKAKTLPGQLAAHALSTAMPNTECQPHHPLTGRKRVRVSVYDTLGGSSGSTSSRAASRGTSSTWSSEDEFHNLFVEDGGAWGGSGPSRKGGRAMEKQLKRLARVQGQRVAGAWVEFGYFDGSDDEESSGEDECCTAGRAGGRRWQQRQQQWEQEDWRWWDDEDERWAVMGLGVMGLGCRPAASVLDHLAMVSGP